MAAVAPAFASAQIGASDVKWDEEWDVLVVGSGFAGSAATCQARSQW